MSNITNSLFIAKPFAYFDRKGECNFPSSELIHSNARQGVVTAIFLDANICLNLSNYARGQKDSVKESMIRQFLLAIELIKGVDVVPYLSCLELASTPNCERLDTAKLTSITANVARALAQSEESLARGQQVSSSLAKELDLSGESIIPIFPMLRYAYGCFLKIFEIRSRGHLKDRAVKNSIEFYDWCEAMGCHIGLVTQAAFAVFGGAREADKLLVTGAKKSPLDAAWGAAWDVWHAWMVHYQLPSTLIYGYPQHCIFATEDAAATFIASQCIPRAQFLSRLLKYPLRERNALPHSFDFFESHFAI